MDRAPMERMINVLAWKLVFPAENREIRKLRLILLKNGKSMSRILNTDCNYAFFSLFFFSFFSFFSFGVRSETFRHLN